MQVLRVVALLVMSCSGSGAHVTPPDPETTPTIPEPTPLNSEPTSTQWQAAENVLRAYVSTKKQQILDVRRVEGLGTTFWVRYDEGGGKISGGVAFVRGHDVITAAGAATVSEILRRDSFLTTRHISARTFYFMLSRLKYLPKFELSPIFDNRYQELNPSWGFGEDGGAIYTLYAHRPTAPHGVNVGDAYFHVHEVTRATLAIRPDYSLAPWVLKDVDIPFERARE